MATYVLHTIMTAPRCWQAVADELTDSERLAGRGGSLYGIWRSQIGRPRDELTAITVWQDDDAAAEAFIDGVADIRDAAHEQMDPTLRPKTPEPPRRQGNYAFRYFKTPAAHWDEFLELCEAAWPGFESAYDSQVVGLWRFREDSDGSRRSLLLTRRPDLAMWERSKIPADAAEAEVRRKLSRRYDLCDATWVCTTTLLTAGDAQDTVRWA